MLKTNYKRGIKLEEGKENTTGGWLFIMKGFREDRDLNLILSEDKSLHV